METLDEDNFSTRKEFRLYDRINFRLKQEILLRDDEIKRLKERLQTIKNCRNSNFRKGSITSNGYSDELTYLQNQIFVESNKAEMRLTNESILHSQRVAQMKQKFDEEIQDLKQVLYNKSATNSYASYQTKDDDSEQVEQFIDSLENIIHSNNRKKRISYIHSNKSNLYDDFDTSDYVSTRIKSDDSIFNDSKSFDLHLYEEELKDNKLRIKQIRQLIHKYKEDSDLSSSNFDSKFLYRNANNDSLSGLSVDETQNVTGNYSSITFDDSKVLQVRAKIQQLTNKHKRQVDILNQKIRKEKKKSQFIRKKIEIASNQSFLTDAELAETIKTQEKIKKRKERKNSLMITIESLSEMDIRQREEVLSRLKIENITLKREIARVDSVAYGRTGKYQYWKRLSDEELLKCTMLYFY